LGVIVKGKELGKFSSVKEIIGKLEKYHFWVSDSLKEKILKKVGENK